MSGNSLVLKIKYFPQDYRANAEKAKTALDGSMYKNRSIKVRFAPQSAAIKCKNLNPFVTNELLEWGFQVFGEVSSTTSLLSLNSNLAPTRFKKKNLSLKKFLNLSLFLGFF